MVLARVLIVAAVAAGPAPGLARGENAPACGFLSEAAALASERAAVARRVLPEPIRLTWQVRHLGDVSLEGPLIALEAADLIGDGRAEILALAPGEAVVIARREPGALEVAGRLDFDALEPAALRPRAPVGASDVVAGIDGLRWWARTSERAAAAVLAWGDDGLELVGQAKGFPLCRDRKLELVPGRNVFVPAGDEGLFTEGAVAALSGGRCRRDLVDADGWALSITAEVSAEGELAVVAEPRCAPDAGCGGPERARARDRGYALAIADFDRDGHPEIVSTARRPPGEPGKVKVWTLRAGELVEVFGAEFAGAVAGLAAGDINGDGRVELIVAVRAPGRHRVEFYALL